MSRVCAVSAAVGGWWSNLSTPSSIWLYFFFSSVLLLLGYRKSDAENIRTDGMILNRQREALQESKFAAADPTHGG